ncbi:MAG: tRNA pseudouridine(55) synthase TruB [Candidatus Omnitrophica bacterium]|nr:tRNA pseudouridine(55) synthase TruB [Candidatus Omnitrophota bacterium]
MKDQGSLEGIIVVNKPGGMTSHDVVSKVRHKLHMRRVGHAGTLDPMATGVLVMLVGKATKLFSKFEGFDKAYEATLILGTKTTTADMQGKVIRQLPYDACTKEKLKTVLQTFLGESEQIPPMVSAIKVNGKKLYELARKGIEVKREPRKIRIDVLKLLEYDLPRARFYVECSKGTYVRTIAEDVGEKMGCGACIDQIERTKVGPFVIEDAVELEDLNESHVKSWTG